MNQLSLALVGGRGISPTGLCVYCGKRAKTRDHVPPKLFLRKPYPQNFRNVPSCRGCNHSFSMDEEYLRAVIGLASFEPEIMSENDPGQYIDRMLSRKPALEQMLIDSMEMAPDGRVQISPDIDRVKRILGKVACGLFTLRYGIGFRLDRFEPVIAQPVMQELPQQVSAAMYYWPGIRRKRWTVVQEGRFAFMFAKG